MKAAPGVGPDRMISWYCAVMTSPSNMDYFLLPAPKSCGCLYRAAKIYLLLGPGLTYDSKQRVNLLVRQAAIIIVVIQTLFKV
jgi:hypothetical protein